MNAPTDLMHTLAWSLLHFLWQGAALAALAAALMYVFRTPATRYLIGMSALGFMLLSFVVTFSLLSGAAGSDAGAAAELAAPASALVSPRGTIASPTLPWTEGQAATESAVDFAWVARGWLVGVFVLALRIAFGLFVIEQLRRRNLVALPDAVVAKFRALQSRLGIRRAIRYCECHLVSVPAVIGFFRPVVLIPMRALTGLSQEQLEALVAHELGHIQRFDVVVNFVQVIAETLFFFHPAVWWLNKRIRADREDCCDDIAVAAGGSSVGYAKALATIATWRAVPSFAMAATGGPVAARVARLLGVKQHSEGARTAGVLTASMVLAGALLAGAISLGLAEAAQAAEPVATTEAVLLAQVAPAAKPAPVAKPAPAAKPAAKPAPALAGPVAPPAPPSPTNKPNGAHETSYIDEMKSTGLEGLSVDEIVAFKVHGITPEFVSKMRNAGLSDHPDMLIAMAVHEITPEFAQQMRSMGFELGTDEIVAMKVHEVTAEYVKSMRDLGFKPNGNDIIAMKVQDITPEYVRQMRDLGCKPNGDDIIAMKVQNITPEYVRQMRDAGFAMDVHELIALKVHDVTPQYRELFKSSGFKLNTDQIIQAKAMDITPEFLAKVRAHGFRDLNFHQIIALKNADVF